MSRTWIGVVLSAAAALTVWLLVDTDGPLPNTPPARAPGDPAPAPTLGTTAHVAPPGERARQGPTLRGRVIARREGAPVAGIPIVVRDSRASSRGIAWDIRQMARGAPLDRHPVLATATTDAEGRFSVPDLPTGRSIRLFGDGPAPFVVRPASTRLPAATVELPLQRGRTVGLRWNGAPPRAVWISTTGFAWRQDDAQRVPPAAVVVPQRRLTLHASWPAQHRATVLTIPLGQHTPVVVSATDQRAAHIAGTLRDAQDRPIDGAWVAARTKGTLHTDASVPVESWVAARTDAAGQYTLEHVVPGRLSWLAAHAPGYAPRVLPLGSPHVRPGETLRLDLRLRSGVRLRGRLLGDGKAIGNATLTFDWNDGTTGRQVRVNTDEGGRFLATDLPPRRLSVRLQAPGWRLDRLEGVATRQERHATFVRPLLEDASVTVHASRGQGVSGTVRTASGEPAAHVRVVALRRMRSSGYHLWYDTEMRRRRGPATWTDAAGHFTLSGLAPGRPWALHAEADDARSAPTEARYWGPDDRVELVLQLLGRIAGTVHDADGRPVAGRDVHLSPNGRRVRTDENGHFTFQGLPAAEYGIWLPAATSNRLWGRDGRAAEAARDAFEGESIGVTLGHGERVENLVLRATARASVSGIIVDGHGQPLPHLDIGASDRRTTTDAEGRFALHGFAVGTKVSLRFAGQQETVVAPQTDLHLTAKRRRPKQTTAGPTRLVEGRVLDADGEPVGAAQILATTEPGEKRLRTAVHAGRYVLHVPEDAERITVRVTNARSAWGDKLPHLAPDPVPFDVAATLPVLRFRLGPVLAGVVRDEAGEPIADATVFIKKRSEIRLYNETFEEWDGDFIADKRTQTDADGRFRIAGVADEPYVIRARGSEVLQGSKTELVTPDGAPIALVLPRGAVVRGRVFDPDGHPVANCTFKSRKLPFTWAYDVRTDDRGAFTIPSLPRGMRFDLTVHPPRGDAFPWGRRHFRDVEAGTEELQVRFRRGHYVEGFLVGPKGEPVAGGHVGLHVDPKEKDIRYALISGDRTHYFRIGPVAAGRYTLRWRPWAGGHRYGAGADLVVDVPTERPVRLVLQRRRTLRIVVRNPDRGTQAIWFAHDPQPRSRSERRSFEDVLDPTWLWASEKDGPLEGLVREDEGAIFVWRNSLCALLPDVRSGEAAHEVTLRPGGAITGRIVGGNRSSQRVLAVQGSVFRYGTWNEDDTFRIEPLPEGRWSVRIGGRAGDGGIPPTVFSVEGVTPGEEVKLDLR